MTTCGSYAAGALLELDPGAAFGFIDVAAARAAPLVRVGWARSLAERAGPFGEVLKWCFLS